MSQAQAGGEPPWYREVTPYMWTVLVIASLGWIFDVFEGQIFVASMQEAMPSLLDEDATLAAATWNKIAFGFFLLGGMVGGLVFGKVSDVIGRTRTLSLTILMYACFSGVTALVQTPIQMVAMRFLVAIGLGGEWAVAAAMVAEVMPERARARLSGVFHASSIFGTYLAVLAGLFVVGNADLRIEAMPSLSWRIGFLVGVVPALLVLWIRMSLKEPDSWVQARERAKADNTQQTGRISELFSRRLWKRTALGLALGTIGLSTFWGVHVYGKDLLRGTVERPYAKSLPKYLRKAGAVMPTTPLTALNRGDGVHLTPAGTADLKVTNQSDESYTVDLDPDEHATVGDVIRAIDAAAPGGRRVARINQDRSGLTLLDTAKVVSAKGTTAVGLGLADAEPTDADEDGEKDDLKGRSIPPLSRPPEPAQAVLDANLEEILELMPEPTFRGEGGPEAPVLDPIRRRMAKLEKLERIFARFSAAPESGSDDGQPVTAKTVLNAKFESVKAWEMLGLFLTTTGGGLGLVFFGPICERIGRRRAFLVYHVGAVFAALALFAGVPRSDSVLLYCLTLPIFGYLTLGMHAGYAIYFPELFPTRLRGTGGGFCFNVARVLAAPILFLSGWMQEWWNFTLGESVSILSALYLLGVVILFLAPETKGEKLPE